MPGKSSGLFCLYGRKPVLEALRLGLVESLEVSERAHGRALLDILREAESKHVRVSRMAEMPKEEGQTLQGVRAYARPPELRTDLPAFVRTLPTSPPPLLLMLDGVTDPHNFGAILRSAVCAGAKAVIVRERRQASVTDVVVKTSAGAAYLIPIFPVVNLARTLRLLAEEGFWSVAAVADEDATPYREHSWNVPTVLIVGAEGAGVSDLLCRDADARVRIPMRGTLDSLNVSVAAGILLFAAAEGRV